MKNFKIYLSEQYQAILNFKYNFSAEKKDKEKLLQETIEVLEHLKKHPQTHNPGAYHYVYFVTKASNPDIATKKMDKAKQEIGEFLKIDFKFNEETSFFETEKPFFEISFKPYYKFALHFIVDHNTLDYALDKIKSLNERSELSQIQQTQIQKRSKML